MNVISTTVAAAVALALLTACSSGNPGPTPTPTTTTSTGLTTATAAPPKTTTTTTQKPTPVTFPGETMSAADAAALQQSVDQGHQPWRVDRTMVAEAFVRSRFGWQNPVAQLTDQHTVEVTNPADGRIVSLQLSQPARQGQGGIWIVASGVWVK